MDPEAAAFSVALYEEGRSVAFGPAINLMVEWKSGGAIVVTLPSLPSCSLPPWRARIMTVGFFWFLGD